jgi:hypothetical protein
VDVVVLALLPLLAGFIVVWITGLKELSTQSPLELLYGRFIDHDGSPLP